MKLRRFLHREHNLKQRRSAGITTGLQFFGEKRKWVILMFQRIQDCSADLSKQSLECRSGGDAGSQYNGIHKIADSRGKFSAGSSCNWRASKDFFLACISVQQR